MEPLFRTKILVNLNLDYRDIDNFIRLTNLHYCGDEQCNKFEDGHYVAKYPEIEAKHPEWAESHRNIRRSLVTSIEVDVYMDGLFKIVK
jgi:hypothetical protein